MSPPSGAKMSCRTNAEDAAREVEVVELVVVVVEVEEMVVEKEEMKLQPQHFMEVNLGPFGSAEEAIITS